MCVYVCIFVCVHAPVDLCAVVQRGQKKRLDSLKVEIIDGFETPVMDSVT